METIKVFVSWCDKNFGATLGDNVPGSVVVTAKTYEELQSALSEALRFHVEGMVEDGDDVADWLKEGIIHLIIVSIRQPFCKGYQST